MQPGHGLKEAEAAGLVARVIEVMGLPALAPLFAAEGRAEQRLAGEIRGQVISGQVDRLRVLPDEILVCDFKTGRHPPSEIEQVPVPYLRQMAAYCALLQGIWPGRPIRCSLIWTETVTVMELPEYLLERYVPG
jgi:ATP-dependent helicase/nuclease subunit A